MSTRAQTEAHYRYVKSALKSDRAALPRRALRPFYSISLSPWAPLILPVAASPLRNVDSTFLFSNFQHRLSHETALAASDRLR